MFADENSRKRDDIKTNVISRIVDMKLCMALVRRLKKGNAEIPPNCGKGNVKRKISVNPAETGSVVPLSFEDFNLLL